MPTGAVTTRPEAILPLRVQTPTGMTRDLNVLIDTGFTGTLALPVALIAFLGLTPTRPTFIRLADGTSRRVRVFQAEIEWDGRWRTVDVTAVGRRPIIGMELLLDHRLTIDVTPGGAVEVTPLP